jgi:hypothetical protein
MRSNITRSFMPVFVILLITMLACNISAGGATPATQEQAPLIPIAGEPVTPTIPPPEIPITATVVLSHAQTPEGEK